MIDLLFDGQAKTTDYLCDLLLGENYHKVKPNIDKNGKGMDDIALIPELKEEFKGLSLKETIDWVTHNFL